MNKWTKAIIFILIGFCLASIGYNSTGKVGSLLAVIGDITLVVGIAYLFKKSGINNNETR